MFGLLSGFKGIEQQITTQKKQRSKPYSRLTTLLNVVSGSFLRWN
jgi:hypothetical protein